MAWDEYLNEYGLATSPLPAQQTTMQLTDVYGQGSIPSNQISGTFFNRIIIGNASNTNSAVYIDTQGIYAGNAVFSSAPFSVDINGVLTASKASISTSSTGSRIVLDPATNSIKVYDSTNVVVGYLYANTGKLILAQNLSPSSGGLVIDSTENITSLTTPLAVGSQLILEAADNAFTVNNLTLTPTTTGFFSSAGTTKPNITGSKGGNVALGSLLSGLAGLGLVTDSTT